MIDVYFVKYNNPDAFSPNSKNAIFCEKTYWDKNKCIEDGYSTAYDKITDAFESIGIDVNGDGEVEWENMSVDQIKNAMESNGINLLIDSPQFIREYTEKFGEDPRS